MSELKAKLNDRLLMLQAPKATHPGLGGFSFQSASLGQKQKEAAVLVACMAGEVPSLILTVRSHEMPHHAGQVALPGGRVQVEDRDPIETALREAEEEIGLPKHAVEVLGQLPALDTLTGFRMTPVVGWVDSAPALKPCDREVRALFQLPLDQLLNPQSYSSHRVSMQLAGQRRVYRTWRVQSTHWPIWGATAGVLAVLAGASEPVLSS